MGEISKACTRDKNISRFEKLGANPDQRDAFTKELTEFLKPRSGRERFEFLDQLRNCFDAQKKLNPNVNLPDLDYLPHPRAIV